MNLVMYAIPFFILLMGAEYLYGLRRGRNTYRLAVLGTFLEGRGRSREDAEHTVTSASPRR